MVMETTMKAAKAEMDLEMKVVAVILNKMILKTVVVVSSVVVSASAVASQKVSYRINGRALVGPIKLIVSIFDKGERGEGGERGDGGEGKDPNNSRPPRRRPRNRPKKTNGADGQQNE